MKPISRNGCKLFCGLLAIFVLPVPVLGANVSIVNQDGPNEGFNDPTPREALNFPLPPSDDNPGNTLGELRLNAFQAAADAWAARLQSPVDIRVGAKMDPQTCSPSSGILGSSGPTTVHANFANAPRADTWFVQALANSLAGVDLSFFNDIASTYNSDVDDNPNCLTGLSWWYGIDEPPLSSTISFFDTVLHEIGHGINFLTLVDQAGRRLSGRDDIFMVFLEDHLEDHDLGMVWPDMTDAQRAASSVDTGNLHWVGQNAIDAASALPLTGGQHPGGHVLMYAPNPYESGSSVSHWDTSVNPDELMEPFATATSQQKITDGALQDMGWQLGNTVISEISVTKTANPTSLVEPGGPVDFTVQIDNIGNDEVEITGLVDDIHGDLSNQGDCTVPQAIAVSSFYQCTFTGVVNGSAGDSETDTVTASGTGSVSGAPVQASDSATVNIIAESLLGDLNNDQCVDRTDFIILWIAIRLGLTNPRFDLNEDGVVSRADLVVLSGLYTNPGGEPCV